MTNIPENEQAAVIHYVDPRIVALPDKHTGAQHEITDVVIKFLRDITVFHAEEEMGEYVAMLPVKVTFKRKI